jgi:hypothetical protein
MSGRIGASVVAGPIGGAVFGLMMQMMTAPTPDEGTCRSSRWWVRS